MSPFRLSETTKKMLLSSRRGIRCLRRGKKGSEGQFEKLVLGEFEFSPSSVKLDFECVEKANLSDNAAKADR